MTRSNITRSKLGCETLETREVPSATLDGGVLRIDGTAGNDTITVRQLPFSISVEGAGPSNSWVASAVTSIVIRALDGNDTVRLNMPGEVVSKPAHVFGGTGNDTVQGGSAADYIDGRDGNDLLYGYGGADKIAGDAGNDQLVGGDSSDSVAGGDGDDDIWGESGNDHMWGGDGYDEIYGGTGADHVYDDYASWAVYVNDSDNSYTHCHIGGFADNSGFGWYDARLGDLGIRELTRYASHNSSISREEMIAILQSATDGVSVTNTEFDDLKTVTSTGDLSRATLANYFGRKVVHGDRANEWFTGGDDTREALGNLYGGADDGHLQKLIDKWFKGSDRPMAQDPYRTTTYDYAEAAGSLFGINGLFGLSSGPSAVDIDQGRVGDCYFLSALGTVADRDPSRIVDMFTDNGDGTFTVRFFRDGNAEYVTVDRFLPVKSDGTPRFAGVGYDTIRGQLERKQVSDFSAKLWVALAEKAYAQANESGWTGQDGTNSYLGVGPALGPEDKNYDGIGYGSTETAWRQITNANTGFGVIATASFNDFREAFDAGKAVCFSSLSLSDPPSDDVSGNHVYMMVGYDPNTGTITLRNPHGPDGNKPLELRLTLSEIKANFDFWAWAEV